MCPQANALGSHPDPARCRAASLILTELGLDAEPPGWLRLHVGPIRSAPHGQTPIRIHGRPDREIPALRIIGGGGAQLCDNARADEVGLAVTLPTWDEHRAYRGYRLDLFALTSRPPAGLLLGARRLGIGPLSLGRLWVVAASARGPRDEGVTEWLVRSSRSERGADVALHTIDGAFPTAQQIVVHERCYALILGRAEPTEATAPGARHTAQQQLLIAARAVEYVSRTPGATWEVAASREHVDVRTLRRYRTLYARVRRAWRNASADPQPAPDLVVPSRRGLSEEDAAWRVDVAQSW